MVFHILVFLFFNYVSLMEDWVLIEIIKLLLSHVCWVEKLKLVTESIDIASLQLLNKVESLHLDERCLQISTNVIEIWLQNERVQEAVCSCLEIGRVVV